jgi:D-alanine-D-alanine ligase-like ATP-grasp enzyme
MDENDVGIHFETKYRRRMLDLIKTSMSSVIRKINPNNRVCCFEIFGYDFIIDADMDMWLIEVNTNP